MFVTRLAGDTHPDLHPGPAQPVTPVTGHPAERCTGMHGVRRGVEVVRWWGFEVVRWWGFEVLRW